MKAVEAKLKETKPDRVDAFKTGAATYAKKIIANFKDYEFVRFSSSIRELRTETIIFI